MPGNYAEIKRVDGTVRDQTVFCTCGRRVGLVHETTVEFFCHKCAVNVVIDFKMAKLATLAELARLIAAL